MEQIGTRDAVPRVRFTGHLKRFFPGLQELQVDADTVRAVVAAVDLQHPGLASYLVDERGALRKHVNIFVASEMVTDRVMLADPVGADDDVFIAQALSGGT